MSSTTKPDPMKVWFFHDDSGDASSANAWFTPAAAQKAAIADIEAIDPGAITGEVLIHTVRLMDAIVEKIREIDPVLDWESTKDVALNMLTHAGARLYEAGA